MTLRNMNLYPLPTHKPLPTPVKRALQHPLAPMYTLHMLLQPPLRLEPLPITPSLCTDEGCGDERVHAPGVGVARSQPGTVLGL